jgi:NAD(P)-dependent dehydrogenase (short-subunit alcohol dehydrogenase family)
LAGDLAGTTALVTGGAAGIGAAVVRRLAARGATVAVADVDGDAARDLAVQVGGPALRVDVADPVALAAAVHDAASQLGRLDLVHLNAGIGGGQGGAVGLDLDRYRRTVAVNLDHVVVGTCAAVEAMQGSGGTIVATASLAGLVEMPLDPIYTATKHAVVGYVRSAGVQLAPEGIRLCALCPGFADTALIASKRAAFGDFPLLTAEEVADGFEALLDAGEPGQVWFVQPGRAAAPYLFRGVPGPATGQPPPDLGAAG